MYPYAFLLEGHHLVFLSFFPQKWLFPYFFLTSSPFFYTSFFWLVVLFALAMPGSSWIMDHIRLGSSSFFPFLWILPLSFVLYLYLFFPQFVAAERKNLMESVKAMILSRSSLHLFSPFLPPNKFSTHVFPPGSYSAPPPFIQFSYAISTN